ncbi:MFS transporter [Geodermatophilus sp. SYSU D00700]
MGDVVAAPRRGAGWRFHGWRIVATLAVTETLSWAVLYYAFAVFQLPMRAELGFSAAETSGAFSLAVLLTGVAAVPIARWLDRHGARGLMTVGSAAAVLLVLAWSRVHTLTGLYLVFAGIGVVSAAVLYEPAFAVVVRWFTVDRGRALLAITLVAGFASTVSLPASTALIAALGWRDALVVLAGVLAVATVVPHALVLRRDPADLGLLPDGAPGPPPAPVRAGPEPAPRRTLAATARAALADVRFRRLTLAFAANTFAVVVVAVHLVPYLTERGHSAAFAATATGALGALSVTGRLLVTGASRRWPVATVTAVAFGLQSVAVLLLLVAGASTAGAAGSVVLFGLGFGVGTIARPRMLADAYGTRDYATLAALLGVALTAAKTAGPVTAGVLRTATGGYATALVTVAAVAALAAVAVAAAGSAPGPSTGPDAPGGQMVIR